MYQRIFAFLTLVAVGLAAAWWLTAPVRVDAAVFSALEPQSDPVAGRDVFNAAGCASCHTAPGDESDGPAVLSGGKRFASDFGTFVAPNISSDPVAGIGAWSLVDFANAVRFGTSPQGQHYYPAFPYTTYIRMSDTDLANLFAYMRDLPASQAASEPHEVGFPFNIRRSLGGWKLLFLRKDFVRPEAPDAIVERGRYLVEALGHCAECHTARNALGGLDRSAWLQGAPNPSGKGQIPSLRPDDLQWSGFDISAYLTTGFTPEFDTAGGEMTDVIKNLAKLPDSDIDAIAAYLLALP